MKTILKCLVLSVIVGLISCKKNNDVYEKIEPLEYFPAFPGSYWVYDNNETLQVEKYERYTYNTEAYDGEPKYETLILPKLVLNGIFNAPDAIAYIKRYSISKSSYHIYRDFAFIDLLAETEGSTFYITSTWGGNRNEGKTIKKDTSIIVQNKRYDNVLITVQYNTGCWNPNYSIEECSTIKEYYAKNVGLIKRERRHIADSVWTKDIELVEYNIKR